MIDSKCLGYSIDLQAIGTTAAKGRPSKSAMWGRACFALIAAILFTASALAKPSKLSPDLQQNIANRGSRHFNGAADASNLDVIVQFKHPVTASDHAKVTGRGGRLNKELKLVWGGAYTVPLSAFNDLAADPDVAYISPDRPLSSTSTGSLTPVLDYHAQSVNAPAAWAQGLNGSGIGVAVIDSGIINSPDLQDSGGNSVVFGQNFVGNPSMNANDQYGHGSHVAGIIAGTGAASTGPNYFYTFKGIAPDANLIDLRVLDQNGVGTDLSLTYSINIPF